MSLNYTEVDQAKAYLERLDFLLQNCNEGSAGLPKLLITIRDQKSRIDVVDFIGLITDYLVCQTRDFTKCEDLLFAKLKRQTYETAGDDETEEVKDVPNILDLSEQQTAEGDCIDLAKNLASILNNENAPAALSNRIFDMVFSVNGAENIKHTKGEGYSPEYIAKILCLDGGSK